MLIYNFYIKKDRGELIQFEVFFNSSEITNTINVIEILPKNIFFYQKRFHYFMF